MKYRQQDPWDHWEKEIRKEDSGEGEEFNLKHREDNETEARELSKNTQ